MASVGTHLNLCYIHESFVPFLFLFLLTAGGILRRHVAISVVCSYVIFLVIKPLGIHKRDSNFIKQK
jgi:hypothetical protein